MNSTMIRVIQENAETDFPREMTKIMQLNFSRATDNRITPSLSRDI